MKNSSKIVVMKVMMLWNETCLTGKNLTLVFDASVEMLHSENRKGMPVLSRSGGGS